MSPGPAAMPRVPTASGRRVRNPLGGLARWKLFDNLRRGLVAPALLGLLLISWLALPDNGILVPLVLALVVAPVALGAVTGLLRKPVDIPLLMHLRLQRDATLGQLVQVLLGLVFLPYETVVTLEVAPNVRIRVHRPQISAVLTGERAAAKEGKD